MEEFISTTELCNWLKVCRATVLKWRNQGLPYYGKDRSLRYMKSEVQKWLDEQNKKKKQN